MSHTYSVACTSRKKPCGKGFTILHPSPTEQTHTCPSCGTVYERGGEGWSDYTMTVKVDLPCKISEEREV